MSKEDFKCFICDQFGYIQAHCPHVDEPIQNSNQIQSQLAEKVESTLSSTDDSEPVDLTQPEATPTNLTEN